MHLTVDIKVKKINWSGHYKFNVNDVNVLGIIGQSGAGKSSLLRAIAGLDPLQDGKIILNNHHWLSNNQSVKPQYRHIAYVTQDNLLFPHLTIEENIHIATQKSTLSPEQKTALLKELGITLWMNKKPHELSGGQKQRVALAQALVQTPKLILFDEPLSALDVVSRNDLMQLLLRYQQTYNIPMVYVSHHHDEIATLTDHCLIIEGGKVIANTPSDKMFTDESHYRPLTVSQQCSVIPLKAHDWHNEDQMMQLKFIGKKDYIEQLSNHDVNLNHQDIWLPIQQALLGKTVYVEIAAQDVILSKNPISQSSIQNILVGTINAITEQDGSFTLSVNISGYFLLAVISKRAQRKLIFKKGEHVYAQIKSMSIQTQRYLT